MNGSWQKIKDNLEKSIKSGLFHLWIRPLEGELQDNTLFLYSPNDFITSWVKDRLLKKIKELAQETLGQKIDVYITTRSNGKSKSGVKKVNLKIAKPTLPVKRDFQNLNQNLTWRYSFKDFVVGPQNELAYTACKSICYEQKFDFGMLFLTSSPGLGKTHLIHSVGNFITQNESKNFNIVYISSEEFANQLVWALRSKEINELKKYYREKVDILLLEDIHFFQGKGKMQEELLYLIKSMEENGKLVIFSSSFLPKELKDIDSQLTSYFCSGLIAPIHKPDYDLRLKIIKKKASFYQINIPENVSKFVASKIKTDIRQLESCIKNLALKAKLLNMTINMDIAKEIIQNHADIVETPSIDQIIKTVCSVFELSPENLKSLSRKRNIVVARNTVFYLARKYTDLTLQEVGRLFNRRHSTVIKGITNIEKEMYKDTPLGRQLHRIVERFGN